VIGDCGALIKQALDRVVPRYDDALQPGGCGNKFRDGYKKVEWLARERERVRELRDKLSKNTERLSVLIVLAER